MRGWLVALVVACSGPAKLAPNAGKVILADDVVVRAEGDGTTSVIARVGLGDNTAFGFARAHATLETAAGSAQVHLARARAWQTLAARLAGQPQAAEATSNAAREVAACRCDADLAAEQLRFADDLVIRREADEVVVLARVDHERVSAAGVVRLRQTTFERAGPTFLVEVARARAWETLSLGFGQDVERAFAAAWSGFERIRMCVVNDAGVHASSAKRAFDDPARRAEALADLQDILRTTIRSCVKRHIDWAW